MNLIDLIKEEYNILITEIRTEPYYISKYSDKHYRGNFNIDGMQYDVDVLHMDSKHNIGEFEIEFSVRGQKNSGERVGKDINHLNTVLYTVFNIVDEIKNKYNIKKFYIDSASDEYDKDNMNTLRGDIYYRFLKNKYPDDVVEKNYRFIRLDFTKKDKNITKLDIIINLLNKISDLENNEEGIRRGVNGVDGDNFEINTDFILNSKYGSIYVEIEVNSSYDEYSLELELMDEGDKYSESFNTFEELYNYIEEIFK